VDVGKLICSLDQVALSGSVTSLFKKKNPLLFKFNEALSGRRIAGNVLDRNATSSVCEGWRQIWRSSW
jgi:hypothetical protein